MSQKHNVGCVSACPTCPCNTCKHDGETENHMSCCTEHKAMICPILSDAAYTCPGYEAEVNE